ncbi:Hypothetical protein D9617_21g097570 [Elsinoe fawcettii]|nr:Hypothetical protein D9617_21g097570 [Elsinoe fawcettii]
MTSQLPIRAYDVDDEFADLRFRPLPQPLGVFDSLLSVAHLRVSEENPPTSSEAHGLDYTRCAALHNAIVKYAWEASGYDLSYMPEEPWWEATWNVEYRDQIEERVHPSVVEFLKQALYSPRFPENPKENQFHYYTQGLAPGEWVVDGPYSHFSDDDDPLRLVSLYTTDPDNTECMIGIVYDQARHVCLYNGFDSDVLHGITEGTEDPTLLWQPLETILTVFIELIEREKIVALHRSVQPPPDAIAIMDEDDRRVGTAYNEPKEPQCDPVSGARRQWYTNNPWTVQAWTREDLSLTLDRWARLVQAIEDHLPQPPKNDSPSHGLYEFDALRDAGLTKDQFAWQFLSQARKPRFTYLAPGLRLASPASFSAQPHKDIGTVIDEAQIPLIILESDDRAPVPDAWNIHLKEAQIPWGLYLDELYLSHTTCPFEDACRLILPYKIQTRVGTPRSNRRYTSHQDLFQRSLHNPYIVHHSTQLATVLGHFAEFVKSGQWQVDEKGVADTAEWWRVADTDNEDVLEDFVPRIGPGRAWV